MTLIEKAEVSYGLSRDGEVSVRFTLPLASAAENPVIADASRALKNVNDAASRIMDWADSISADPEGANFGPNFFADLDRLRAEMRDTRQAMIFADDALTRIEQELIG